MLEKKGFDKYQQRKLTATYSHITTMRLKMSKSRLTRRQRVFAEYCLRVHTFRTHTDAYIAVYHSKGSRRTATANASRIYNMPAVQEYVEELDKIQMQRAVYLNELERQNFLDSLAGYR